MSLCSMKSTSLKKGTKRGQLKLTIWIKDQQLEIHLIQARNLTTSWADSCDAYVQVSLCPDENSRWTTKAVSGNNSPVFNQNHSVTLRPGDDKKRVFIAMWHKDIQKRCSDFLGCMSFGLEHFKKKLSRKGSPVSGWFQLLSENVGHRKHVLSQRVVSPSQGCLPRFQGSVSPATHASLDPRNDGTSSQPAAVQDGRTDGNSSVSYNEPSEVGVGKELRRESTSFRPEDLVRRLQGLDKLTIVVGRSGSGYGFTVKNTCPVRVGRVKGHSCSEAAGLRKGDFIVGVNGQGVARATAASLAVLVRQSRKRLVLDLRRRPVRTNLSQTPVCIQKDTNIEVPQNSSNIDAMEEENRENIPPCTSRLHKTQESLDGCLMTPGVVPANYDTTDVHFLSNALGDSMQTNTGIVTPKHCSNSVIRSPKHIVIPDSRHFCKQTSPASECRTDSHTADTTATWEPYLSDISRGASSTYGRHFVSSCDIKCCIRKSDFSECESDSNHWICDSYQNCTDDSTHNRCLQTNSMDPSTWDKAEVTSHKDSDSAFHGSVWSDDTGHRPESLMSSDGYHDSENLSEESTAGDGYHGDLLEARQQTTWRLFRLEEDFVRSMQRGIQQFSRPLRHGILSTEQHTQLFQNIEKLVVLSECHLHQLSETEARGQSQDGTGPRHQPRPRDSGVGDIYRRRVQFLTGAYRTYIRGLPAALHLLKYLRHNSKFTSFIEKRADPEMTIVDFVQRPERHMAELYRTMSSLLQYTSGGASDWPALCHVVWALDSQ